MTVRSIVLLPRTVAVDQSGLVHPLGPLFFALLVNHPRARCWPALWLPRTLRNAAVTDHHLRLHAARCMHWRQVLFTLSFRVARLMGGLAVCHRKSSPDGTRCRKKRR